MVATLRVGGCGVRLDKRDAVETRAPRCCLCFRPAKQARAWWIGYPCAIAGFVCHCAGVFCVLLAEMTSQARHSKRAVKSILYETQRERIPGIPKYEFLQALRIPYEKNLQNWVCFKDSIFCLQITIWVIPLEEGQRLNGCQWLFNPLQYSCLENPMDGGAWWAAV